MECGAFGRGVGLSENLMMQLAPLFDGEGAPLDLFAQRHGGALGACQVLAFLIPAGKESVSDTVGLGRGAGTGKGWC